MALILMVDILLEGGAFPDAGEGLLLGEQFLNNCIEEYFVPSANNTSLKDSAICIADPLSSSNNIGQSFARGNLKRMAKSLNMGSEELRSVLRAPDIELKIRHYLTQKLKIEEVAEEAQDELLDLGTEQHYHDALKSLGPEDYHLPVCKF